MQPANYNFKIQYAGDTFNGLVLTAKLNTTPINLTDVVIKMQIRTAPNGQIIKEFTNGNGITIINALIGQFRIDSFNNPQKPFRYVYDLQFRYLNGIIKTYMKGFFTIAEQTTQ